jgi:hypothetical protein
MKKEIQYLTTRQKQADEKENLTAAKTQRDPEKQKSLC